jgi:hypothetical protein
MDELIDFELTPEERAALHALPRERMPARHVVENTVRRLRQQGLLRAPRPVVPVWWRFAAALAAVALFGGGIAVGQRLDANTPVAEVTSRNDGFATAAGLQQAGTEYVNALAAVAESSATADPVSIRQAREVALTAFWGAANEIVRIAPDDPLVVQIILGFDRTLAAQTSGPQQEARHVLWF